MKTRVILRKLRGRGFDAASLLAGHRPILVDIAILHVDQRLPILAEASVRIKVAVEKKERSDFFSQIFS